MSLVEKLFGSFSDRELKKVNPIVKQVLALEPKYAVLSNAELQAQTPAFKQQLADGKTLDDILPDAFAVCREAAWRVLGMKHFPVQVIGGSGRRPGSSPWGGRRRSRSCAKRGTSLCTVTIAIPTIRLTERTLRASSGRIHDG